MSRRFFIPVAILYITLSGLCAQTDDLDSAANIILQHLRSETGHDKKALQLYDEYLPAFRYDANLFDAWINHLLATDVSLAGKILKVNPFLVSQHNEQALYHYYVGISQMLDSRGWPFFKEAEKSMNRATAHLRLSLYPDYGFFSDLENARGYLSVTARGASTDSLRNKVCIVRTEFIYMAIDHYREALIYNPNNTIAQQNLDTLLDMLETAGIPPPPNKYAQNVAFNQSIVLDSVDIDSMNDVTTLPVLDYTLLPRNYQLILRELQAYDEIMLLIDLSGSMDDAVGWSNEASKFHVAHQLAIYIALNLRANVFLGALSIGQECDVSSMVLHHPIGGTSRSQLTLQIAAVYPDGHTPLNRRIRMTRDMFSARRNKKLVFLLSDGLDTCGEIPDLCGTAEWLAAHDIDLSVFSFIYETLEPESRSVYAIYNCMVRPSGGKIYTITESGGVDDDIDFAPVSNNLLVLPPMDSSSLWTNHEKLFQFTIGGVEPPVDQILKLKR